MTRGGQRERFGVKPHPTEKKEIKHHDNTQHPCNEIYTAGERETSLRLKLGTFRVEIVGLESIQDLMY